MAFIPSPDSSLIGQRKKRGPYMVAMGGIP